ncbi:MAG: hypothetical protein EB127_08375 [Alphaproteobacteria bacterium]|nr:hypothetical protein [Alphaproteobacteria bacterium]
MTDIYTEAQQDYQDSLNIAMFKKFMLISCVSTFIAVLVMLIMSWNQSGKQKILEDRSYLLYQACSESKITKQLLRDTIVSLTENKDGIADIAKLKLAVLKLSENKIDDAILIIDTISTSASNIVTKNLAKILYLSIIIDQDKISDQMNHKAQVYITSIDKTQPFFAMSQIYSAFLKIKSGSIGEAEMLLGSIMQDTELSFNAKKIANSILHKIKWRN